jgi:thiol-disulfide isomerase/thioredoxin
MRYFACLGCACLLFFFTPSKGASGEIAVDQNKLLEFISEAFKANLARMERGTIHADVRDSVYDKGGKLQRDTSTSVTITYRSGKIRCDYANAETNEKTVLTDEAFYSHFLNDPSAYIRKPALGALIYWWLKILPERNAAIGGDYLSNVKAWADATLSVQMWKENVKGVELYRVERVRKKDPENMDRYYVDPNKGCAVVRREILHDFGKGYVLLREENAEVQPTSDGGWYLKRFVSTLYRPDGTLSDKKEIEIKEFDFKSEIADETFTWKGMGLAAGTQIIDRRQGDLILKYDPKAIEQEAARKPAEQTVSYEHQMSKRAEELLVAIKEGKSTRDDWRRRFALLNKPAPTLEVDNWIQSGPLCLADLRGRVVLLEFWGITCGPCLGDIPKLNEIHKMSADAPVTVIGLHYPANSIAAVKDVVSNREIKYPVCMDRKGGKAEYWGGRTFEAYGGISGIPATFLIDFQGRIRSVDNPVDPQVLKNLIDEVAEGKAGSSPIPAGFGVKYTPSKVDFSDATIGRISQKSVFIHKPDDPGFIVEISGWPASPAKAGLFRYADGEASVYEARVVLDPKLPAGIFRTEIRLKTNDPEMPVISIPVEAKLGK